MTTENKYNREAIYVGRRLWSSGKVVQSFLLLPELREMSFSGIKRVWIGYTYKCTESQISTKPERTNAECQHNAEWDAADALVDAHNAKKRSDAKMKALVSPALKAAVNALVPLVKKTKYIDQDDLVRHLVNLARSKK